MIGRALGRLVRTVKMKRDPVAYARSLGVTVGDGVRIIGMDDRTFGSEPFLVSIGDHVTVTGQVQFITHDGGVWVFRNSEPDIQCFRPICVGSNVFIGLRSLILPGVTIGDNVVIGAGSIVNRDVPSNSVAAGVPARVVGTVEAYREKVDPYLVPKTWSSYDQMRALLERKYPRR